MMFVSNSKTVVHTLTPAIGSNGSPTKFPAVSIPPAAKHLPFQVRSQKERFPVQDAVNGITRREMMHFTAVSLTAIALFLAEPCEARVKKPEARRKILEKLELERKKAGVSKNNLVEKPTPQPKETNPSLPIFPDLWRTQAQSPVEATKS